MVPYRLRQVSVEMLIKHIIIGVGVVGLSLGLAGTGMAQTAPQSKQPFVTGMRHAEIGNGISRFSSFNGPKSTNYFVHCNCADLSSDTKICPTKGYQCACSPATVYCQ